MDCAIQGIDINDEYLFQKVNDVAAAYDLVEFGFLLSFRFHVSLRHSSEVSNF